LKLRGENKNAAAREEVGSRVIIGVRGRTVRRLFGAQRSREEEGSPRHERTPREEEGHP